MRLLSSVEINNFRSIKKVQLDNLTDFTVLAGMNNSGKSNILKSLNLFFTGAPEPGVSFDTKQDFHSPSRKMKKKKFISVEVSFSLPSNFSFRTDLKHIEEFLGKDFSIVKRWSYNDGSLEMFLNTDSNPLSPEDTQKVNQFLGLISFRYIPNRVLPLDVIRAENASLRDVIIRRLTRVKASSELFDKLKEKSNELVKMLSNETSRSNCNVSSVRLATPASLAEMIFSFGYKIEDLDGFEIDDTYQGSGLQSLLMFQTLYLIDKDRFQQFGWRQASIWAVEEPESSLHMSLEAQVASSLREMSTEKNNRLQIFSTTHSDLMIQQNEKGFIVSRDRSETEIMQLDYKKLLKQATALGVSRWTHPLLIHSGIPLILVEGKKDILYATRALEFIGHREDVVVACLEELTTGSETGGDELINYIKMNVDTIKVRSEYAPVVVLLDWDATDKIKRYKKMFSRKSPFTVVAWPENISNSKLSKRFKGTERYLPTRIVKDVKTEGAEITWSKKKKQYSVDPEDYNKEVKQLLYEKAKVELKPSDFKNVADFFRKEVAIWK